MAALFGPLAGAGFRTVGATPQAPSYTSTAFPADGSQWLWRRYLGAGTRPPKPANPVLPIYPAPPVHISDVPSIGLPFGPAPAASVVGTQRTRPDRLFGPFARIGVNVPGNSTGLSGAVSLPGM